MVVKILEKHSQWAQVVEICQRLQAQGYEAVLAGGCVRDALLGRSANDLDVATNARPEQVEEIFERVITVGKSFGVCRVVIAEGTEPIEVATFREEFDYKDGRRPERIVFSTLEKDAKRRDFTINAMFYDLQKKQVIDVVDGQKDLKEKILRTVGSPEERFQEDSLRLLRAARFAAQLGFSVEAQTQEAIRKHAPLLARVSRERWQEELNKVFLIDRPGDFFANLQSMNLQEILFPDWKWDEPSMHSFFQSTCLPSWGWSALVFLQTGFTREEALSKLTTFKLSNQIIRFIEICAMAERYLSLDAVKTSQFIQLMREKEIDSVIQFLDLLNPARGKSSVKPLWERLMNQFAPQGSLPRPLVSGDDLLRKGIKPGAELGAILEEAYLKQIENPSLTKEQLLKEFIKN